MRSVLNTFIATGVVSKEGIEDTAPAATPVAEVVQPAIETDTLDGASVASISDAEQEIETAQADEGRVEVGNAIEAATELDSLQVALEEICESRLPTKYELQLIRNSATRAMKHAELDFITFAAESGDLDTDLCLTREDLRSASTAVWDAIKKALGKLSAGLAKAWHTFVFWLKPAQSQIKQFLGELQRFEGELKFPSLKLKAKPAVYSGLGDDQSPAGIIKALEAANRYVYGDLFHQIAQFSASGTPVPKISDEPFVALPCSPRFRVSTTTLHFLEQPPTPKNLNVMVPDVEIMKEWCQAFLDEALYFIQYYESFKSTAEKIYDAVRDQVDDEENETAAELMDAGSKALFARSHSCIDAMESWVWYAVRVMTAHHGTLLALRKAFV